MFAKKQLFLSAQVPPSCLAFLNMHSTHTTAILELTVRLQWLGTSAANMVHSKKFKAQALAHTLCQFQHSTNQAKLQSQNG